MKRLIPVLVIAAMLLPRLVAQSPEPTIMPLGDSITAGATTFTCYREPLLAQVIPAGKLPKYSYIPDFNLELAALAKRLDQPTARIILGRSGKRLRLPRRHRRRPGPPQRLRSGKDGGHLVPSPRPHPQNSPSLTGGGNQRRSSRVILMEG